MIIKIIDSLGKNNEIIRYIKRCIRGMFSSSLRKKILMVEGSDSKDALFVEHNGSGNPDEIISIVKVDSEFSGFYSLYIQLLWTLKNASRLQNKSYISLGNSQWYSEKDEINNSHELFDYYFEQPFKISKEEIDNSENVIVFSNDGGFRSKYDKNEYNQYGKDIKMMAAIQKKYIKLNTTTKATIFKDIEQLLKSKKTLGVHCRGTDYKAGFDAHAIYIPVEEYILHTKKAINEFGFTQIFLATDEENTIELFRNEFGEQLVYYNAFRAVDDSSVGIHMQTGNRFHHNYLLGLEVIKDAYTLSSCEGLLAGKSGVARNAIITKVCDGANYEYLNILDRGTYHGKVTSITSAKKIANRVKNKV